MSAKGSRRAPDLPTAHDPHGVSFRREADLLQYEPHLFRSPGPRVKRVKV